MTFAVTLLGGKHCLTERRKTRAIDLRLNGGCRFLLRRAARKSKPVGQDSQEA